MLTLKFAPNDQNFVILMVLKRHHHATPSNTIALTKD